MAPSNGHNHRAPCDVWMLVDVAFPCSKLLGEHVRTKIFHTSETGLVSLRNPVIAIGAKVETWIHGNYEQR